jgi:uncharacterized protein YjiS (DUF1127 family)
MSVVPIVRAFELQRPPRNGEISSAPGPLEGLYALVAAMAAAAVREARIRRDMRRIAEFDDHMLRDLGVARSDIEGVVRRGRDGTAFS